MTTTQSLHHFKVPTTLGELHQLQRETTELVIQHRRRVALNKLCPRRMSEAQRQAVEAKYKTTSELIEAAGRPAQETARKHRQRGEKVFMDAMADGLDVWDLVAARSNTVDSWYTARAALHFYLIEMAGTTKREIDMWDAARRANKLTNAMQDDFHAACNTLPAYANALAATPFGQLPDKFKGEGKSKRAVNSKSHSLRGRPDDWREKVAAQLSGDRRLLFLIQCVSGCRPVELARGVRVVLLPSGELSLVVQGAKLTKHAGQPFRSLSVGTEDGVARELARLLGPGGMVDSTQLIGSVDAHRKAVARAGQKAFPAKSNNKKLASYSARNQFKSNAKAAGLSPVQVAKAMGHSTTRSGAYYGGGARSGKGAVTLRNVNAARAVKPRHPYPKGTPTKAPATQLSSPSGLVRQKKPRSS